MGQWDHGTEGLGEYMKQVAARCNVQCFHGFHLPSALLTLGYAAGIFWLSSEPAGDASGIVDTLSPLLSNALHIPLFGGLAALTLLTLSEGRWRKPVPLLTYQMVFLGSVLYAISDELHQAFVPGRSANITDVALDMVGIAAALGVHRVGDHGTTGR